MKNYLTITKTIIIFALLFNSSYALTFHNQNKLYFGQSRLTLELNSTEVEPIYIMDYYKNYSLEILTSVFEGIIYTEGWKDIEGCDNLYQISTFGRVKSLNFGKQKILRQGVSGRGYLVVCLYKNGTKKTINVHQTVAEIFLNHTPCGMQLVVNHKDFNRQNNHVSNLEIITVRKNNNKKHIKSSSEYIGVHWHKISKKWQSRITTNGKTKHLGLFDSELEASKVYQNALTN